MVSPAYPELFRNYLEFCSYRAAFHASNTIDLSDASFFYPATLLPLLDLILQSKQARLIEPANPDVANYLLTILGKDLKSATNKSYIPLVFLPNNAVECRAVLESIYELREKQGFFNASEDAFAYVVGELVDNIYQHSHFQRAMVMAQNYGTKGFIELGFYDNGITIAGSFDLHGWKYNEEDHYKAIFDAVSGLSSRDESGRGFGLRTTTEMFVEDAGGQVLIVSGSGAVHINTKDSLGFRLSEPNKLKGTLVCLRAPSSASISDIYRYVT